MLSKAGGEVKDVIRTRIFLKDIEMWKEAAHAHGEVFSKIQPACTFVEVSRFINPGGLLKLKQMQ